MCGARLSQNNCHLRWGSAVRIGEGDEDASWSKAEVILSCVKLLHLSGSSDLHAMVFMLWGRSSPCRREELKCISLVGDQHWRSCFTHLQSCLLSFCFFSGNSLPILLIPNNLLRWHGPDLLATADSSRVGSPSQAELLMVPSLGTWNWHSDIPASAGPVGDLGSQEG